MWFRKRKSVKPTTYEPCPHCGEQIVSGSSFCKHCGSSDDSGWHDDQEGWSDGGYSDDEFDYEEFVENEFPEHRSAAPDWKKFIILLILIGFLVSAIIAF